MKESRTLLIDHHGAAGVTIYESLPLHRQNFLEPITLKISPKHTTRTTTATSAVCLVAKTLLPNKLKYHARNVVPSVFSGLAGRGALKAARQEAYYGDVRSEEQVRKLAAAIRQKLPRPFSCPSLR
ncbi:hypothetical protein KIN20_001191 [Parelaphostrongylus tenuis]|uniref:Uncharacterized protein n=1 Tax=Parelaphostrongylus tenuis TaxID=148309 RepID=A0AAD5LXQ7_PARTN|nr:hypothetical protein KIN20_001191 [Parelaphostrongylus tenuis]